jgi:hypothetical protein
MLSVAKHLWPELQILRFAQDDNSSASVCQRTSVILRELATEGSAVAVAGSANCWSLTSFGMTAPQNHRD